MLETVVRIEAEQTGDRDLQLLGWNLAFLGRDDELRRMDFHPEFDLPPLEVDARRLELNAIPWRDAIAQIGSQHRIVMIMEDHFVSKHREMIRALLPTLRKAGYTHYAAEAIGESGTALVDRGYPSIGTGYYTSDPQFGNLIRRAVELKFKVLGYDFRPLTHEIREEYAATTLADVLTQSQNSKLLVHAGHSHVLKRETDLGQRWLAARLWDQTGIEPFTIWQWSERRDGHEYRIVADALGEFSEPVLLMPPPTVASGLRNIPDVDAILVHPRDQSIAPHARIPLFPAAMHRIAGRWTTHKWPVVIAAFKRGEPINAVPLDQVMLRPTERDFSLWVPDECEFEIVAFNQDGPLVSSSKTLGNAILVQEID